MNEIASLLLLFFWLISKVYCPRASKYFIFTPLFKGVYDLVFVYDFVVLAIIMLVFSSLFH